MPVNVQLVWKINISYKDPKRIRQNKSVFQCYNCTGPGLHVRHVQRFLKNILSN